MLKEIIALSSENHSKPTNVLIGINAEFVKVRADMYYVIY
jgi:hypothetical protein